MDSFAHIRMVTKDVQNLARNTAIGEMRLDWSKGNGLHVLLVECFASKGEWRVGM